MYLHVEIGSDPAPYGTNSEGFITGRVTLTQKFNHHDLAEIWIPLHTRKMGAWATGDPVVMQWESQPGISQQWIGYVHSVERLLPRNAKYYYANVIALGATYPMKTNRQANWGRPTLKALVEELAERHHFTAIVPGFAPKARYPMIQSGESDWAFLVKQCTRAGMLMYADKTTLFVRHPLKAMHRDRPFLSYTAGELVREDGQTSDDLEGGASQVTSRVSMTATGIGGVSKARMPTPVSRVEIVQSSDSVGEAELRVQGRQPWGARTKVSLRVLGTASARLSSLVYLDRKDRDSGLWLTEGITHVIGNASDLTPVQPWVRTKLDLVKPAAGLGFALDDQSKPGIGRKVSLLGSHWRTIR